MQLENHVLINIDWPVLVLVISVVTFIGFLNTNAGAQNSTGQIVSIETIGTKLDLNNIILSFALSFIVVAAIISIAYFIIRWYRRNSIRQINPELIKVIESAESKLAFLNIIRGSDWFPSLALFQFFLWTIVILFAFTLVSFLRGFAGDLNQVAVPNNLLILMGLSVATPVVSTAISSTKYPNTTTSFGPPKKLPGYSSMLQENDKPSLTRFQMFLWTGVSILFFLFHLFSNIAASLDNVDKLSLPNVDDLMVALMGISQGAYIGGKIVSQSTRIGQIFPERVPKGGYVSIFGNNFGTTKGVIWVGPNRIQNADPDANLPISFWSDDRIDFKLGDDLAAGTYDIRVSIGGTLVKSDDPLNIVEITNIEATSSPADPGTAVQAMSAVGGDQLAARNVRVDNSKPKLVIFRINGKNIGKGKQEILIDDHPANFTILNDDNIEVTIDRIILSGRNSGGNESNKNYPIKIKKPGLEPENIGTLQV